MDTTPQTPLYPTNFTPAATPAERETLKEREERPPALQLPHATVYGVFNRRVL